jgi:hypothetical protein
MPPVQPNLEEQLRRCTVRIEGGGPCGTGFFVAPRLILTCAHVVEEAQKQGGIYAVWSDRRYPATPETILEKPYPDLALLRLAEIEETQPCVYLMEGIQRGDALYGWGYPKGYRDGDSVQADYEGPTGTTEWRLKLKAGQVLPGFSGAPLLNLRTGGVCGVIKSTRDDMSALGGWAIPARVALARLPDLALQQQDFHRRDRVWARHVPIEIYLSGVQDYCGTLPYLTLGGAAAGESLPDVYVPLKLKRPLRHRDRDRDLNHATLDLINVLEGLDIAEALEESAGERLVIVGGPGAGKSCLLRYLAMRAWHAPDRAGLGGRHLPLLVSARSLAEAAGSLEDRLRVVQNNTLPLLQNLPAGFLNDWSGDTGLPWLLMVDALDELPDGDRRKLLHWLNSLLQEMTNVRVILTSREGAGVRQDLDSPVFRFYELLSLTDGQTAEIARRWLGAKADPFLKETERTGLARTLRAPLLVTLAIVVYARKGALPERLELLYGEAVSTLLREARERGLDAALDPRVGKVVEGALASLALELTRFPNAPPEQLRRRAGKYLRSSLQPISEAEAAADGAALVDALGRHSGLLTRTGDSYDFIHATFREYLSARDVADRLRKDVRLLRGIVQVKFREDEQVIRFLLGILSDDPRLVQTLVKGIYRTSPVPRLLRSRCVLGSAPWLRRLFWPWRVATSLVVEFLAECLIQGVALDERTRSSVLGDLHRLAGCRVEPKFSLWLFSAEKLARLGEPEPMAAIARDEGLPAVVRQGSIGRLALLNYRRELESLCNDPGLGEYYRTYARCLLESDHQIDALVRIAGDDNIEPPSRIAAIARLLLNGQVERVLELENTGRLGKVLHAHGRVLTTTYVVALIRKSRAGSPITQEETLNITLLYDRMSKYMIDDKEGE